MNNQFADVSVMRHKEVNIRKKRVAIKKVEKLGQNGPKKKHENSV